MSKIIYYIINFRFYITDIYIYIHFLANCTFQFYILRTTSATVFDSIVYALIAVDNILYNFVRFTPCTATAIYTTYLAHETVYFTTSVQFERR